MIFKAVNRSGNRILMKPETPSLHYIRVSFPAVGTIFRRLFLQRFSAPHTAWFPDIYNLFSAVRTDSILVYLPAERADRRIQKIQQEPRNSRMRSARLVYLACSFLFCIIS